MADEYTVGSYALYPDSDKGSFKPPMNTPVASKKASKAEPEAQPSGIKYASPDDLIPKHAAAPLSEDYTLPGSDLTFRIEGLAKYEDRENLQFAIEHFQAETLLGKTLIDIGEGDDKVTFSPTDSHIRQSFWAAACVKSPQLTRRQWLQFAWSKSGWLSLIYYRALICSRVIGSDDEGGPKDGVEAAKEALKADPLDTPGSDSVLRS